MHGRTHNVTHGTTTIAHRLEHVAGVLSVSKRTVYRLIKRGDLTAVMVGADLRVLDEELTAYIERIRQAGTAA